MRNLTKNIFVISTLVSENNVQITTHCSSIFYITRMTMDLLLIYYGIHIIHTCFSLWICSVISRQPHPSSEKAVGCIASQCKIFNDVFKGCVVKYIHARVKINYLFKYYSCTINLIKEVNCFDNRLELHSNLIIGVIILQYCPSIYGQVL